MFLYTKVKWVKDNIDGYLNFYSVSGDGRVTEWTIVKGSLLFTDALNIPFTRQLTNFYDVATVNVLKGKQYNIDANLSIAASKYIS